MSDLIERLQSWYVLQCDDVWEHSYGVSITTIDNPGWCVSITGASSRKPLNIVIDRDEDDINWIYIEATNIKFSGHGGSANLGELLNLAVAWLYDE